MSEIKKLGFGLMRLPQKSGNATDIDMEQFKQMADLFLERGFTYFDTSYVYHDGASHVGIVVGRNSAGRLLICHCSSKQNNVVVTEFAAAGFTVDKVQ